MKRIIIITISSVLFAVGTTAQTRYRGPVRRTVPVRSVPVRPRPVPPASYYAQHGTVRPCGFNSIDVYYGFRLGMGVSTVLSDDRRLDGGSAKTGVNLGFVGGIQLEPSTPIYFETGLLYASKGGKGDYNGPFTYSLNYLEVPFVLKYQYHFDRLTSIQPFAGVFGALGVSGKIKEFDQRVAYSAFDDDGFRRLDGGLRFGCGLQFDHLYAEIGYDLGLANISRDFFDSSHTGSFFANIGVNF